MLSRFPGSSEHAQPPAAVTSDGAAAGSGAPDKPPALADDDEPLPETYARDQMQLLVQSPYRLYAYWQHARDPYATLRRAFGPTADGYQLAVRLLDTERGTTLIDAATPARNYWFDVQPGRAYRAEVGFAAAGKPFFRLLASEVARTPPVSVAPEADEGPEFQVGTGEFARVVNEAGYVGDALALALEASDEATQHESTLTLAHTLAAADLHALDESALAELRALIVALVCAEPLAGVRARLSPPLARWLDALLAQHGGQIGQPQLLDTLRVLLGFELEIDEEAGAAEFHPTSPAWSASGVRQPERRVRVWLPSMTPGRGALPPLRLLRPTSVGGSHAWLPSMSAQQQSPLLRWRKL